MKNLLFLLILLVAFTSPNIVSAQENDIYIEEQIAKLDKELKKGAFKSGCIYTKEDTLKANIFCFRKRKSKNHYLFCLTKDENDTILVYKPKQIEGYMVDSVYYKSHCSGEQHFFIKRIHDGEITLYDREEIPSDYSYLYYVDFIGKTSYFVIDPYESNFRELHKPREDDNSNPIGTLSHFQSKGLTKKFKYFINHYFSNCLKVVNLVNADFYTVYDLPRLVEIYNNCPEEE